MSMRPASPSGSVCSGCVSVDHGDAIGEGKSIALKITTLLGGVFQLDIDPTTTVRGVKQIIAQMQQIPVRQQNLVFNHNVLPDETVLADAGVADGGSLRLVLGLTSALSSVVAQPDSDTEHEDVAFESLLDLASSDAIDVSGMPQGEVDELLELLFGNRGGPAQKGIVVCREGGEISVVRIGGSDSGYRRSGARRHDADRRGVRDHLSDSDTLQQRLVRLQENTRHRIKMTELAIKRQQRKDRKQQRRHARALEHEESKQRDRNEEDEEVPRVVYKGTLQGAERPKIENQSLLVNKEPSSLGHGKLKLPSIVKNNPHRNVRGHKTKPSRLHQRRKADGDRDDNDDDVSTVEEPSITRPCQPLVATPVRSARQRSLSASSKHLTAVTPDLFEFEFGSRDGSRTPKFHREDELNSMSDAPNAPPSLSSPPPFPRRDVSPRLSRKSQSESQNKLTWQASRIQQNQHHDYRRPLRLDAEQSGRYLPSTNLQMNHRSSPLAHLLRPGEQDKASEDSSIQPRSFNTGDTSKFFSSGLQSRTPTLPALEQPIRIHHSQGTKQVLGASSSGHHAKKLNRCSQCNHKLKLAATYNCHCGEVFCGRHRYPEDHDCSFDYKEAGRHQLTASSPKVEPSKLPKI